MKMLREHPGVAGESLGLGLGKARQKGRVVSDPSADPVDDGDTCCSLEQNKIQ